MALLDHHEVLSSPLGIALRLAPSGFLGDIRSRLIAAGVAEAVHRYDNAPIFDWASGVLGLQGISDRAAIVYQRRHGSITWSDVQAGLHGQRSRCPRLRSWWRFQCGYRKTAHICAEPDRIDSCSLPRHELRKGVLNEAAYAFAIVIRDICDNDLVGWIDGRLAAADLSPSSSDRGQRLGRAVLDPLTEIPGTVHKIWSMVLADLLLGADSARERWIAAGASMIAIDTLVHAFLHRTGTLRRYRAEHAYGPRCYAQGGCADVIDRLAKDIDARAYDPQLPRFCPRFVQHAIWYFCAEGGWNTCNGRQIDDRYRCRQPFCPAGPGCARLPRPK